MLHVVVRLLARQQNLQSTFRDQDQERPTSRTKKPSIEEFL